LFEVGSPDVPKTEQSQYSSQSTSEYALLSATYDWWSEGGQPMIFLKNNSPLPIKIHWNKSYFVIDDDTLMCYLSLNQLKSFNGYLLPPIIEKDQLLWPYEEISFEGYPFVLHTDYVEGNFKDMASSPVIQKVIIKYEIEEKTYELQHNFYISEVIKTSRARIKTLRTSNSLNINNKFYKTKKIKIFASENFRVVPESIFDAIVEP